jgi:hypothetical protein
MMLAVLIAIRDFLLAAALAWVGVTMEPQRGDQICAQDSCQTQSND